MKIHQTVCDVCGAVKKETNHWFKVDVLSGFFRIVSTRNAKEGKDICGQECASKLLSQWMATGTIDSKALQEAVTL